VVAVALKKKEEGYVYSTTITVEDREPDTAYSIDELPAFVTVIELDPETPRFQTVPEVLSSAVGVTVRDFGGLGKLSTVSIRGSSSNQVLVLMDGIRMNNASGSGVDLSNLPLENIEKIEVLRGADSAVYGDGAMGGVVNLVTRKESEPGRKINGRFSYGSFGTLTSDLEYFHGFHGFDLRVYGSYHRSDGDFEFTNDNGTMDYSVDDLEDLRINNDLESASGNIRINIHKIPKLRLTGSLEGFFAEKGIPGMTTFPSEFARQEDSRISTAWRVERELTGFETSSLALDLSGIYSGLDFDDPYGEQTGVPIHSSQRTTAYSSRMTYGYGFESNRGYLAAEYRSEELEDSDFSNPDRDTVSLSGKHDIGLFQDKLWITVMGRFDDVSDTGDKFSPKLGIKWFVTPHFAFKANAGSAYRSPSFNELYMDMGYISGNPDLKPETSESYDIGVSWETSRFRTEAAYFQVNSEDLIQYLLGSGVRYKPFNIGKAESRGVELDLGCTVWRNLKLSAAWTWLKAEDRSEDRNYRGKQIPGRPENEIFSRLEWDSDKLKCFVEWRHISGNYITRANTRKLTDRETGNLGIQYKFYDFLIAGAELKNFTDNEVVDVRGFPLPGRTGYVSIRVFL